MKTADFDYRLPENLIAQEPLKERDRSRMMVLDRSDGTIKHYVTGDLPNLLEGGDLLVMNDTKVIPARIFGQKQTGGRLELLFLEPSGHNRWRILMKSSNRPKPGEAFYIGKKRAVAVFLEEGDRGEAVIEVGGGAISASTPPATEAVDILKMLDEEGFTPLPPYIRRNNDLDPDGHRSELRERERYQTIYAKHPGAVAAPTAGLHFTERLFQKLEEVGVQKTTLTLHTGLGTFRPVSTDRLQDHRMHDEWYELTTAAVRDIRRVKDCGRRCIAVGSTSVRTLESVCKKYGELRADSGRSDLFIYPPYTFRSVDGMLTNFHLPKSTLLMMVCALAGTDLTMEAYRKAVEEKYRFFSYGDSMLIL